MKYRIFGNIDDNQHPALFTFWSLIHFMVGIIIYFWVFYFFPKYSFIFHLILSLFVHTIYEFKDYYISYIKEGGENSLFNSFGDTIAAFFGIVFGYYIVKKYGVTFGSNFFFTVVIFLFQQVLSNTLSREKFD